ncbi:pre-mrna-splicing factor isy1 [Moniliophthora roreri MCA 2997]|uniref:Pre-mrna-splicing factor isy1 n=2 Tax=Moniliophthora roreri TaxID=221103 RepID=V2Y1T8_MONRO|nr:pre-mrna-splicing factor isy1 [Moniliophthora roreri MCA 2997]KAI3613019.1 pre-mrna-splicing factor isy1 [Moniliophthora roreri]
MARNEEKAQSMLYRFREAQAAELGLGTRADRRPRMASACKSLRECERWRGEILREISRKVSKIQDAGLTDYEVRDLNDEINKLIREKRHWENQIVALGGANYRRNVAMLDDDGKEVPGTKGYKYFGRAKDLPGVRELFQSRKKEEEEEDQTLAYYKKFTNQGPAYYGDLDENDDALLKYEAEVEGEEWEEAFTSIREALGLPDDTPAPKIPRTEGKNAANDSLAASGQQPKRKVPDPDGPADTSDVNDEKKRTKTGAPSGAVVSAIPDPAVAHAQAAAAYIPFLDAAMLMPPKMPTRQEMEDVLLDLRKKALVEEYFGNDKMAT